MKKKFYGINNITDAVPGWINEPKPGDKPDFMYIEVEAQSETKCLPENFVLMFNIDQIEKLYFFIKENTK
jgi:hypothetical protein